MLRNGSLTMANHIFHSLNFAALKYWKRTLIYRLTSLGDKMENSKKYLSQTLITNCALFNQFYPSIYSFTQRLILVQFLWEHTVCPISPAHVKKPVSETKLMKSCEKNPIKCDSQESLQEKCWQEDYKGDSRKWLIRDASGKSPRGPLCSTMKESFIYPEKERSDRNNMGKRREYLTKKFYEEAFAELKETDDIQDANDYCTEYDGNFKKDGFHPDNQFYMRNAEQFQKYPLYSSAPVTYYSHNQQKHPKKILPGLTRITDPQSIFKRNGQFSKPIGESLDYVEL